MNINQDEVVAFEDYWNKAGGVVEIRDFFPWTKQELQELGDEVKYPGFMPCPFPWQYVVVQWNGDVVACCRDYDGQLKLGNVKENTLKEIWNGREYADFRAKMTSGDGLTSFCNECLSIYYNEG